MHIANPIYDGAFMYMLEDSKVARFFFSAITDEEIEEIISGAQTIGYFDFPTKIKTGTGSKTVIIEFLKVKDQSDLIHFQGLVNLYNYPFVSLCH